jgi:hypothetical protein
MEAFWAHGVASFRESVSSFLLIHQEHHLLSFQCLHFPSSVPTFQNHLEYWLIFF